MPPDPRRPPLILVNGLAEQAESWFAIRPRLSRRFDVREPEVLAYDGEALHRRIDDGGKVTVDYLADRLADELEGTVHRPPYYLVGSSLGGQIVLTYAARRPERVAKLVLLCPSGLHGEENLPMMEGVRRSDYGALVGSVFFDQRFVTEELVASFRRKFEDRRWKRGLLRTLRGTVGHSIAPHLPTIQAPTLVIWGAEDRILSDLSGSIRAAGRIPRVRQVIIPRCGHAPQVERPRLVNRLISRYLRDRVAPESAPRLVASLRPR